LSGGRCVKVDMSFRDLEGNPRGVNRVLKQPRQCRDEESTFERTIKARIQVLQDHMRIATDQLSRSHGRMSKRTETSIEEALEKCREVSQEVERIFQEWTVHLAGEPSERHRKRFSCDKLKKAFETEQAHFRDLARRAIAVKQEALVAPLNLLDDTIAGEDEVGLLDDSCRTSELQSMVEDSGIQNRVAREREEGIQRIRSSVSEVNQMFRDLASIVVEQGQQFHSIEDQVQSAASSSKGAVRELKTASDRQRASRERFFCLVLAIVVLCVFSLLPHFRTATGDTSVHSLAHGAEGAIMVPASGVDLRHRDFQAPRASPTYHGGKKTVA